jgi:isoprenylcysteine carboxyl methyltransferase (ICMT) family protein YpbQ
MESVVKIRVAATLLCALWWIAECIRSSIRDKPPSKSQDQKSSMVWDFAHLLGVIGVVTGFTQAKSAPDGWKYIAICRIALMLMGISIRWSAIHALGDYFSGKISLWEGQPLIQVGLYQYVRHPAYAGSCSLTLAWD